MRVRKRLMVLALLVLIGSGTWLAWPRHNTLLDRARPLADVSDWSLSGLATYYWLSPQDVLFFYPNPHGQYAAARRNIATGVTTTLTALTGLLQKSKWNLGYGESLMPSPDGKWLLWVSPKSHTYYDYYFASVDGSHYAHWAGRPEAISWKPLWMPDSRHWILLQDKDDPGTTSRAMIYSIDSPRAYRTIPLSIPAIAHCSGGISESTNIALQDRIQANLVCEDRWAGNDNRFVLRTVQTAQVLFGAKPGTKDLISIPIPKEKKIVKALFDPNGLHILWIARSDYMPPYMGWLHRLMPSSQSQQHSWYRFWVSGPDGKNAHEIGQIEIKPDPYLSMDMPFAFSWLPDGKRVSFIYENKLYTVPVD